MEGSASEKDSSVPAKSKVGRPRQNAKWKLMYQQLVKFKQQNGHCLVAGGDPELRCWVYRQRKEFREKRMTPDRKKLLDDVGFSWKPPDRRFAVNRPDAAHRDEEKEGSRKERTSKKRKLGDKSSERGPDGEAVDGSEKEGSRMERPSKKTNKLDDRSSERKPDGEASDGSDMESSRKEHPSEKNTKLDDRSSEQGANGEAVDGSDKEGSRKKRASSNNKEKLDDKSSEQGPDGEGVDGSDKEGPRKKRPYKKRTAKLVDKSSERGPDGEAVDGSAPPRVFRGKMVSRTEGKHEDNKADHDDDNEPSREAASRVESDTKRPTGKKLDDAWMKKYEHLVEYKRAHGNCLVRQRYNHESLGQWVHTQRLSFRSKKMPDHRKKLLDEIGFCWKPPRRGEAVPLTIDYGDEENEGSRKERPFKKRKLDDKSTGQGPDGEGVDGSAPVKDTRGKVVTGFEVKSEDNKADHDADQELTSEAASRVKSDTTKRHAGRKLDDDTWMKKYEHLVEYKRAHGNCLVSYNDELLGQWVNTQRQSFLSKKMPGHRKKLLDEIGFCWEPPRHEAVSLTIDNGDEEKEGSRKEGPFKKRNLDDKSSKRGPDGDGEGVDGSSALNDSRGKVVTGFEVKSEDNKADLDAEEESSKEAASRVKLNTKRRAGRKPDDDTWMKKYEHLVEYKRANGDCLVRYNDELLGQWVRTQRQSFRSEKMPGHRKKLLDEIGFCWEPPRHDEAVPLTNDNETEASKSTEDEEKEDSRKERQTTKRTLDDKSSEWGPDGEAVDGSAPPRDSRGKGMVTGSEMKSEDSKADHDAEKEPTSEAASRVKSDTKRRAGRNFDDDRWMKKYEHLVEYKRAHGNCLVRYNDELLGQWVNTQRQRFRSKKMPGHRKKLLDEIGFCWEPPRRDEAVPLTIDNKTEASRWKERYEALVKFKQTHGHCMVKYGHELYYWTKHQETRCRDGKMPEDRKNLLEAIGFCWEPVDRRFAKNSHDDDDDDDDDESVSSAESEPEYAVGTKVQAFFDGDGWFSGRVTDYNGVRYEVTYEDGDKEVCCVDELAKIVLTPDLAKVKKGTRVAVRWPGDGKFYNGTVTRRRNKRNPWCVEYDGGSFEWLSLRKRRFHLLDEGERDAATEDESEFEIETDESDPSEEDSADDAANSSVLEDSDSEVDCEPEMATAGMALSNVKSDTKRHTGRFDDEKWNNMYQCLLDFKRTHGHCRVKWGDGILGRWVSCQRQAYRKKKMPDDRKKLLNEAGFCWWPKQEKQKQSTHSHNGNRRAGNVDRKMNSLDSLGTQKPTEDDSDSDEISLVDSENDDDEAYSSDDERGQADFGEGTRGRARLHAAKPARKARRIPRRARSDYKETGRNEDEWIEESVDDIRLSPRTKRTGGGQFDNAKWKDMYEKLVELKRKNGNCIIGWNDRDLFNWARRQRKQNRNGRLPADRKQLLIDIGFPWNPPDQRFRANRGIEMDDNDFSDQKPRAKQAAQALPHEEAKYRIGTKVQKLFQGHGWYTGEVTSFDGEYYLVTYEDGDEEEYNDDELAKIVLTSKRASKVEIGSRVAVQRLDGQFYNGRVTKQRAGECCIEFDEDGAREWVDLTASTSKFYLLPDGHSHRVARTKDASKHRIASNVDDKVEVGSRVSVQWPRDYRYYDGTVTRERKGRSSRWRVEYDVGGWEWVDLRNRQFRLVLDEESSKESEDESLSLASTNVSGGERSLEGEDDDNSTLSSQVSGGERLEGSDEQRHNASCNQDILDGIDDTEGDAGRVQLLVESESDSRKAALSSVPEDDSEKESLGNADKEVVEPIRDKPGEEQSIGMTGNQVLGDKTVGEDDDNSTPSSQVSGQECLEGSGERLEGSGECLEGSEERRHNASCNQDIVDGKDDTEGDAGRVQLLVESESDSGKAALSSVPEHDSEKESRDNADRKVFEPITDKPGEEQSIGVAGNQVLGDKTVDEERAARVEQLVDNSVDSAESASSPKLGSEKESQGNVDETDSKPNTGKAGEDTTGSHVSMDERDDDNGAAVRVEQLMKRDTGGEVPASLPELGSEKENQVDVDGKGSVLNDTDKVFEGRGSLTGEVTSYASETYSVTHEGGDKEKCNEKDLAKVFLSYSSASEVEIGSRIAVHWPNDGRFNIGTVTKQRSAEDPWCVEYDDGDFEWVDLRNCKFPLLDPDEHSPSVTNFKGESKPSVASSAVFEVETGSRVWVQWPSDKLYHGGTVTQKRKGQKSWRVEYDNGSWEWLNLQKCEFHRATGRKRSIEGEDQVHTARSQALVDGKGDDKQTAVLVLHCGDTASKSDSGKSGSSSLPEHESEKESQDDEGKGSETTDKTREGNSINRDTSSREDRTGTTWVGPKVKKFFEESGWSTGAITSCSGQEYRVTYENGVSEDYNDQELAKFLFPASLDEVKVGCRVAVYRAKDGLYHEARVMEERNDVRKPLCIEFKDGSSEWVDLRECKFRLLSEGGGEQVPHVLGKRSSRRHLKTASNDCASLPTTATS